MLDWDKATPIDHDLSARLRDSYSGDIFGLEDRDMERIREHAECRRPVEIDGRLWINTCASHKMTALGWEVVAEVYRLAPYDGGDFETKDSLYRFDWPERTARGYYAGLRVIFEDGIYVLDGERRSYRWLEVTP